MSLRDCWTDLGRSRRPINTWPDEMPTRVSELLEEVCRRIARLEGEAAEANPGGHIAEDVRGRLKAVTR